MRVLGAEVDLTQSGEVSIDAKLDILTDAFHRFIAGSAPDSCRIRMKSLTFLGSRNMSEDGCRM